MTKTYSTFSSLEKQRDDRDCISARRLLVITLFLGFVNNYTLRVNLSVAIVAMTNLTDTNSGHANDQCPDPDWQNATGRHRATEFSWDSKTQGFILGSFFYGYIVTQLLGGFVASRVGGKPVFGLAIFFTAVLTLFAPLAARTSVNVFAALRVLEGLCEGVTYPTAHYILGQWIPRSERSRLASFTYAGSTLGSVITWPLAGLLSDTDFLGGWPSVFYVFGALACLWCVAWALLVYSTPADHPRISREEREYIEASIGRTESPAIPWKSILTSLPVWSIVITQFCGLWVFYLLLNCLPTYLKTIHNFDIKSNGVLSALPYATQTMVMILVGHLADFVRSRGYLSTTNTRKVMTVTGLLIPGSFLITCGYVGCNRWWVVSLLAVAGGGYGFVFSGFFINHLDIAPRFAGVLMGLSNTVGTLPGFLVPAYVGYLTNHSQTISSWQTIFLTSGCVCLFGSVITVVFCSGEEQDWARISCNEEDRGTVLAVGNGKKTRLLTTGAEIDAEGVSQ